MTAAPAAVDMIIRASLSRVPRADLVEVPADEIMPGDMVVVARDPFRMRLRRCR